MTPFAVYGGSIKRKQYELFLMMRNALEALPDGVLGDTDVSCHHMCHAFGRLFALEVVDGRFGKMSRHSWLVFERDIRDQGDAVIADLYPVAGASPLLVYTYFLLPWRGLYVPDREFVSDVIDAPGFEAEVETFQRALKKALPGNWESFFTPAGWCDVINIP